MGGRGLQGGRGTFVNRVDNVDNIIARFYGYGAGKGKGIEKKSFGSQKKVRIDAIIIKTAKIK